MSSNSDSTSPIGKRKSYFQFLTIRRKRMKRWCPAISIGFFRVRRQRSRQVTGRKSGSYRLDLMRRLKLFSTVFIWITGSNARQQLISIVVFVRDDLTARVATTYLGRPLKPESGGRF